MSNYKDNKEIRRTVRITDTTLRDIENIMNEMDYTFSEVVRASIHLLIDKYEKNRIIKRTDKEELQ